MFIAFEFLLSRDKFFVFFLFTFWKQEEEKGKILRTINHRSISFLVYVINCKLYAAVNLSVSL